MIQKNLTQKSKEKIIVANCNSHTMKCNRQISIDMLTEKLTAKLFHGIKLSEIDMNTCIMCVYLVL